MGADDSEQESDNNADSGNDRPVKNNGLLKNRKPTRRGTGERKATYLQNQDKSSDNDARGSDSIDKVAQG